MATALYNRYRPRTFAEVVGQQHVTDALGQALRSGRMHHAYLFSGPRGCGKTSSARILAASLNCVHGPTPDPCGVCEHCTAIRSGTAVDVVEIDAASHGLVEDTRDLRERAAFLPASGRYRVFVIDEAHMITPQGFNALLKIVEEPPPFVVFVFATTDPDKVLTTIRSRTFHYQFGLVPPKVLEQHLAGVCAAEGVTVEPAVLPLVVRVAEGSVRDSLSVLDQLLAGVGSEGLGYAVAVARLGLTDALLLDEAVDALAAHDAAGLFGVVGKVVGSGQDPRRFATDLLERLRDLVLLEAVPDAAERGMLDMTPTDQLDRMRSQAVSMGAAELSRAADVVHTALVDMRGTTTPRLVLELLCARILLPGAAHDEAALMVRLERLERRLTLADGVPPVVPAAGPTPREAPGRSLPPRDPAPVTAPRAPATPAAQGPAAEASATRAPTAQAPASAAPPPPPPPSSPDRPGAPPAAARAAWPDLAPLPTAGGPPEPPPAAASPGGPPTPGETPTALGALDLAGLRLAWPQVLDAVRARKRMTHAVLVPHADVVGLSGSTVTLAYALPAMARRFQEGVNPDVLVEALAEVLGGTWKVVVQTGGSEPVPAVRPARAGARDPGFAPGDEAAAEDPDVPVAAERVGGEDAAVALLRAQMGATVIGAIDHA